MLSNSKALLFLAIVGIVVFANSLNNAFLIDDHAFFNEQKVTAAVLFSDFIPDVHMTSAAVNDGSNIHYYRPMAHLVPMVSYLIFGNNVAGHHAINLLLWVLAAWMVFIFMEGLLKDSLLALAVAFLYLVHPINGVLVNYITADVFSVEVICMLGALWFLIPKKVATSLWARPNDVISIFLFLVALLCHETAMALPFYATIIFMTIYKQNWKQALKKTQWLWLTLAVYFLWRLKFASLSGGIVGKFLNYHMNIFEYAATLGQLLLWYVSKLFWPMGIIMIKAEPIVRDGGRVAGWLLVLAVLVGAWVWLRQRNRRVAIVSMGLWWFAAGFLPFCFATMFRPEMGMMIEPHWFVFSVIGFFVLIVYAIKTFSKPTLFKPIIITIGLCLAMISFVMNSYWNGDLNYSRYWVAQSPGFSAPSFYLAMSYERDKDYEQSRYWYNQVLSQKQYRPEVIYTALGYIDLMENHLDDASSDLHKALAIDPTMATAVSDIGIVAFTQKHYDEAQEDFLKAIDLDQDALLPRLNLGKVFLKKGQTNDAINAFAQALSLHPDSRAAVQELVSIGMSAQKAGDMHTATQVYQVLMKFAPNGMSPQQ